MIASPYAKKLAREAGVDISQATASGPDGRIVAADVQKLISEGGGKGQPQQSSTAAGAAGTPQQSGKVIAVQRSKLCGTHLRSGTGCFAHPSR